MAHKKVESYDPRTGRADKPSSNNAYKFELFIHNFLPFCQDGRVGALKVSREEEFAPVKNANPKDSSLGADTPRSAKHLLLSQHNRWVQACLPNERRQRFADMDTEVDLLLSYEGEGQAFYDTVQNLKVGPR